MSKPVIVCAADIDHLPEVKKLLESNFSVHYVIPDEKDIISKIQNADAYLASLHTRFTANIIKNAPKLKAIATPSTGTDHIDIECAKKSGITILSLKDEREFLDSITATAELAWGLILACCRNLTSAVNAAKQGNWARDEFRGHQIAYKTLGILGCGRLGSIVAEYGRAFRMNIIACDKVEIDKPWIKQVSFDELINQSDILSIHLIEDNKNLIDKDIFTRMKKGVVLINTSRGAIINEQALINALEDGTVAAAGLDVIDGEWRKDLDKHILIKYMQNHNNLIITPHIGGVTFESQKMAYEYTIQKMINFFNDKL